MDRRAFLSSSAGAALLPLLSTAAFGQPAPPGLKPSQRARLAEAVGRNRLAVGFDGQRFSGAGYDWLLKQGSEAKAFLLGEEHGIAENPKLAAQLFTALVPSGYSRLAVETSPPMAAALDRVLRRGGAPGLRQFVSTPGSQVAFFGLREEADFLATASRAVAGSEPMLWGMDYEVMADRYLIRQLQAQSKPMAAQRAVNALAAASKSAWDRFGATHDPRLMFSFGGDPTLVAKVREAWPNADPVSRTILHTLEETLEINRLWIGGKNYESNLRRVALMRFNLLNYWHAQERHDPKFRLFMKMGANHLTRGLNMVDMFDLGTLVPDLVAERGGHAFHLMVLPGPDSQTASFDPVRFQYAAGHRDEYGQGMDIFSSAVLPNGFTIFPTAPLRPLARAASSDLPAQLMKAIHGFDAVLVMTGSHPSSSI